MSERNHDSLADLPEYAGSPDTGMRDSLPPGAPELGDVVDLVEAEGRKLDNLLSTMVALADQGQQEELDQRWYGVVRELFEFTTAEERVVWPAVAEREATDGALRAQHEQARELADRLRAQDEMLDRATDPGSVLEIAALAGRQIELAQRSLVPALRELPEDQRLRLGEDVRQVMG